MSQDIDMIIKESSLWTWWPLHESWGMAVRAYVYGKRDGKNPERYEKCKKAVINAVNGSVRWQNLWAIRCSFSPAPYKYNRWGWYFISDVSTYDMLLARSLVDEKTSKKYFDAACLNADQELGNNPDDYVSITGIGQKRIVDHVHQNSRFDGIVEPVPGIPQGFFPSRASGAKNMFDFSHGGLPIAYRYVDAWTIAQEFTVPNMATTVMTYAMLADPNKQKSGRPTLKATANGKNTIEVIAPAMIHFKATAKGANGKQIRDYCWDFGNEDFASDKEFDYTFTRPGLYNICCTVTDEDGWIAYKEIKLNVKQPLATLPNKGEKLKITPDTVALFHFDDNFKNAVEGGTDLITNDVKLSKENLMWMKTPSGDVCKPGGDVVEYKFGENIFSDPSIEEVHFEVFVNFEEEYPKAGLNAFEFILTNAHVLELGRIKGQYRRGPEAYLPITDKLNKLKTEKEVLKIIKPTPGWHLLAIGFSKKTWKAYMQFGDKKVEFDIKKDGYFTKNTSLNIGAFSGYFDELRIRIKKSKNNMYKE